ncbi:Rz-like spanin [Hafnia phage Enc34]|uniref:Rz1 protein n=1 Tax=Hafnia phage Enc34 TaxID=1150990 RepID=H6WYJ7_9CAUD|nr:Rz-like spanin [Hafnia phage Enc34]AFB84052.1 putative Rz1 protein [Hafnia phage Enc34]
MKRINSLLVALLISFAVSGCVKKIEVAPSFCAVATAIYIGEDDTLSDETARQILIHDEIGERLCGWGR